MNRYTMKKLLERSIGIFSAVFLLLTIVPSAFAALPPLPAENTPYNLRDRFATDLFTGSAAYSYTFKIPKGTNDLTPNISLSYNSSGVRDFSQRVGLGWQLTQNYVERDVNYSPGDTSDDKFKLHFNGGVYDLVYVASDSRYHTKIESNLNIQKLSGGSNDYSDYWQVITTDGTKYRFGYASQSELGCNGRSYAAAWNLDQVTDVHGNTIYYSYTETNGTSYINQIKYNNDQSREIDFTYSSSPYQRQLYIQGCNVTDSSLLSNIQIKVGTSLIHEYDFNYSAAGNNQELLQSITEKGSDAASTLPATTFDYKTENKTWSTTPQTWINNAPMDVNLLKTDVEMADVTGDGLLDIVKSEGNGSNTWKVWRNTGNGWNTTYETWVNNQPIDAKLDRSDTRLIDVTGDGLPDIVKASDASSWKIWRNLGNSWSTYSEAWGNFSPYGSEHYLGSYSTTVVDVTGDGLPDVVSGENNRWRVFRNTGSGWNGSPETWNMSMNFALNDPTVRIIDVNGDGLPDIVKATANGTNDTWQVWKNNGNGWNDSSETWINNAGVDANFSMTNVTVQDVNGDGLPDIVKSDDLGSADRWKVLLNQGNSWSTTWVNWIDPSSNVDLSLQGDTQMADVTGDGLPDIIKGDDTNNPGGSDTWYVWKNNGLSPDTLATVHTSSGGIINFDYGQAVTPVTDTVSQSSYTGEYFNNQTLSGSPTLTRTDAAINFSWDNGSPDPSISADHFSVRWTQTKSFSAGSYMFNATVDDGVRLYVDGELLIDQWNDHAPLTFTASKALSEGNHTIVMEYYDDLGGATAKLTYQKIGLPFPLWQVSKMTVNNGMTNSQNTTDITTYNYKNAFYKFENREFRGFGEVDTVEPNGSAKQNIFNQDNAAQGRLASRQTTDATNNPYTRTEDTWSAVSANGIYTSNLTSEKNYTYDSSSSNPKVTENDFQYDTYGNVTKQSQLGDTSTNTDNRFVYNEYTYNPTAWIVNTTSHSYLNASDDAIKVSENWFYYDGNANSTDTPSKGDLTKEVKWLDTIGGTNPTTQYGYDTYGNQTSVTDANNHTTTTSYDTAMHTYPISTTNAKNQTSTVSYDPGTGNVLSKTDPNGISTSYTYDVFGRVTKEIKPYDSSSFPTTQYQYFTDGAAPEGTLVSKRETPGTSGTLDSYLWTDGLSRKIQTRSPAENTTQQIVTDTFYDPTGQIAKLSIPHFDTLSTSYAAPVTGIRNTLTSYDPVGRPITITNTKGDVKTISYDHWKETTIDENGHITRNYKNAFNKISKVDEVDRGITYSTTYAYTPRDQLSTITDAVGNTTSFVYDSLGRKTSQADPDMGTWKYEYDGVGNLTKQTDNRNIAVAKTYDELDRITKTDYPTDTDAAFSYDLGKIGTLSIATDSAGTVQYQYDNRLRKIQEQRTMDSTTWTTGLAYDSLDRITSKTYPDAEVVNYTFNSQGEINAVAGATALLNNIDYNALGKITKKDFSNGLTTNYTYNTDDFRLNRIQTGTLQDLNYSYDHVGNVASITDAVQNKTQNFTYDDFDRLKTASQSANGYNYAYQYNAIGNLLTFTNAGNDINYTYGQSAGPHALTASTETVASSSGIYIRAAANSNNGTGGSSLTINKPAGTTTGDVMIAHIVANPAGNTITVPTGWTLINRRDSAVDISTATYWKVAGGSEPTTYTWTFGTSGEASGGVASYVNVDNTSPIDASNTQYNSGTSTVSNTGITTTTANDMLVYAVGVVVPTTVNAPSGFTQEWTDASSSITTSEMSDEIDAVAGATGSISGSHNGGANSNITHLVALRPKGTAPTPTPTNTLTPTPTPSSGITLRGATNNNNGSGGSSLTINTPTGTANGDVLVAHIIVAPAGNVITAPSGWTQIMRRDSSQSISTVTYWKLASSSEPSNYTWTFGTSGEASGGIAGYIGVNSTTPIDASNVQYNASTSTVSNAGVTTTAANDKIILAVSITVPTTVNVPTGFTQEWSTTSSTSTTSEMSDETFTTTGATGTITGSHNGGANSNITHLIALKPAGTTVTPTPTNTPTPTPTPAGGITFRAASSNNSGTGGSSLMINKPTGTITGDVMIAHIVVNPTGNTITAPTGWTLINRQDSSVDISTVTYWKAAGSSEPTSYTWSFGTSGEASGGIASYTGVNTTTPIDASSVQYNHTTSTVSNSGVTTTVANDMLVFVVGVVVPTTVNAPTGFTEEWSTASSSITTSEMSQSIDTGTGATGTITGSHNGGANSNITQLIALKPQ